jgi:hypothetical protein
MFQGRKLNSSIHSSLSYFEPLNLHDLSNNPFIIPPSLCVMLVYVNSYDQVISESPHGIKLFKLYGKKNQNTNAKLHLQHFITKLHYTAEINFQFIYFKKGFI